MFSNDTKIAIEKFKEFNERKNNDACLEDQVNKTSRLTDEEARLKIKDILGIVEIAQVKSLPKLERNELLRRVKGLKGTSLSQGARILGVSISLIQRS